MAGKRLKPEREFTEESMKMLFGKEITDLHDDGFEESSNERRIFMEVFYGKDKGYTSKSCVVTSAIHFEEDESMPLNASSHSNCENSTVTSSSSMRGSSGENVGAVKEGFGLESVKRIRLLGELPGHENKEPSYCVLDALKDLVQLESSSEVAPDVSVPGSCLVSNTIAYRVAESSSLGIASNCILLKDHGEKDVTGAADEGKASDKTKPARSGGRDPKKVSKRKFFTSPVSQESSASKNLSPDTVTAIEDEPGALSLMGIEEEPRDSDLLKSDSVNGTWKRDFIKKLRPRLREHIKHILLAAGWEIEMRKRKNKPSCMDTIYLAPTMKVIFSLPSAWKSCGENLFSSGICSMQQDNGRQWVDVSEFWFDLSDTLAYIEKEMQKKKSSVSIQKRWIMLDPFVTIVFVDKKIGVLTAGRPVTVIRGVSVELNKNQDVVLAAECIQGDRNQTIKMDGDRNQLVKASWDQLDSLNGSLVPSPESDNLRTQLASCLYSTPVVAERIETVTEGIQDACNHHDVNQRFSISCERNLRNEAIKSIYTSRKSDSKRFHDGDVCDNNPMSLAMGIEKSSTDAANLGSMKLNFSASESKKTAKGCHSVVPEESHREDLLIGGGLAQEPAKSLQVLELPGSTSVSKTVDCRIAGELATLGSNVEICVMDMQEAKEQTCEIIIPIEHNRHCRESMPCLHPPQQNLNHGVGEQCNDDVHALVVLVHEEETILSEREMDSEGLQPSEDLEERTQSAFEASATRDACATAPEIGLIKGTQKRTDIIASKSYGEYKRDDLCIPGEGGSHCSNFINFERGQETPCNSKRIQKINGSVKPSECIVKFAISNQQSEEVMVEQQIPFLYQHENLCNGVDENCKKEVCAQEKSFHPSKRVSMQMEQSPVYHGSPSRKLLCFGINGKPVDSMKDVDHQRRPNSSEMKSHSVGLQQFEFDEEELDVAFDSFKSKNSGEASALTKNNSTKRIRKKSKKISEIKATKCFSELTEANLPTSQMVKSQSVNFTNLDGDYDDVIHCHLKASQKQFIGNCRKCSPKTSSVASYQNHNARSSKFKKHRCLLGFQELDVTAQDRKNAMKLRCKNKTDETPLLHAKDEPVDPRSSTNNRRVKKSEHVDLQASRKTPNSKKSDRHNENGLKRSLQCSIDDDDLLVSAIIRNKNFTSDRKHSSFRRSKSQSKAARKRKSQNGPCKLLVRSPGKGGKYFMDGNWFSRARTVLAWLLDTGVVSVNDVIQYRSPKEGAVIKSGRITRDGILCKCCNKKLSMSEFKIHAGFKLHRPCLNLFLESGKPLTICQLEAWSSEYKSRKGGRRQEQVDEVDQNDDTCGLCGDGGELICCDHCPSTFHQLCLSTQELPKGNWYCPNCICDICGDVVNEKDAASSMIAFQCSQCENKYHKTCINENGIREEAVSGSWFCGGSCREVYLGLRSCVGILNHIADGFSWTLLRCIQSDQKIHSARRFALTAECNTKLAVALNIMEESFLPMVDPRTGIDMIPHVLYNWGSDFTRLNYQGFYTVILEKGDEVISVASIRVHGVALAEMPLIATCSEHRRQGMCRRLMNEIEEMLKSFKVEMLVLTAIPTLVETWTTGFGFKAMSSKEKKQLTHMNLMMFPGTTMLKKKLHRAKKKVVEEGLDNDLPLTTDGSKEIGVCDEHTIVDPGLQPVGISLETKQLLMNCGILPLEEEEQDSQLKQFVESYTSEPISTAAEIKDGDVSNIEQCSTGRETIDTYDGSWHVSTDQVSMRCHMVTL